jgi:hypothetical protein
MSAKTLHPDEKFKAGNLGTKLAGLGLAGGVVLLIVSYILGHLADDHLRRFQYGFLTAWMFVLTIAIGSLFFVLIHHLTRARWSTVLRRVAECVSLTFPALMIIGALGILLPMWIGNHELYFWDWFAANKAKLHLHNHHLEGKLGWLNPGFFALRFLIYMGVYSAIAMLFAKLSRKQDESGDPAISEKLRIYAGPAMLIFSITTVFVGFDMMMSLAPNWYSTIYSVNMFGGCMIATYAFLAVLTRAIQKSGRLTHSVTVEHYHDLGKLLFGFTFFWAYTAFSQFMLIWYANIPEETVFFRYRWWTDWQVLCLVLIALQWALPYVALLSRWSKRILPVFMAICVWQMVFHYADLYWNIMPNMTWGPAHEVAKAGGPLTGDLAIHQWKFAATDVVTFLGMVLLFLGAIGRQLRGNLVPVKDPMLGPSLAFENY